MQQASAHNAQMFNPFHSSYNFVQPQPVYGYGYGFPAYAPVMPFMGYSAYNPMSSYAYGYGVPHVPVIPAPMPVPQPMAVGHAPQVSHLQQSQVNHGRNNMPQNNPISSFINNVQPMQQGFNGQPVHNPYQNSNVGQIYPQPPVVNNNPAFNPFNIPNNGANTFYGANYQQGPPGRRW